MPANHGEKQVNAKLGRWQQPHLAPTGRLTWADVSHLGSAAQVEGKGAVVATIRKRPQFGYTMRVNGWLWKVTPEMGIYRFTVIPGGKKITETPVKAFKTLRAAKAEAAKIIGGK